MTNLIQNPATTAAQTNAVVYHCATPDPAQALLIGNGPCGASVHTPDDALYLLLGRCDIWRGDNSMGAIAAVRVSGGGGLFSRAASVRQECDLFEAKITIEVQAQGGAVRFTIACLRGHNLYVVDIYDERPHPASFAVTLENWHEGECISSYGEDRLQTWHVNETSDFAAMNAKVGVDAAALGLADPLLGRAWGAWLRAEGATQGESNGLVLAGRARHQILLATPCAVAGQGGLEAARNEAAALLLASPAELELWKEEHAAWWREFWAKSYLELESGSGDAEYEERLWFVAMYCIASGSGGPLPLRFNGGPWLLERDERTWDWGYWFQNMREIYWPLFAAGHWELARGFFEMYFAAQTFVRAQTQSIFGIGGLSFKETQTFWGQDCGTDLENNQFHPLTHRYFSGNLEVCLLMEWFWRGSGDEDFARTEFYPLLKEVVQFYQEYSTRGDDGIYHFEPVNALETWCDVRDALPDLCGLHHFLPRLVEWGVLWGEEAAQIEAWREFHEQLPPLPVGRWSVQRTYDDGIHDKTTAVGAELDEAGIFIPAAGVSDGGSARCNMENVELYPVFPWGVVGLESPPDAQRRAKNTWNHRSWRFINNGWAQDVVQLARLGWAQEAARASLEHASYSQRFPNGCFICPAGAQFHGLLTANPYFDAAGVHAAGISEMLLQSHDGIVRLCPATSPEWSGAFKLHAFDGFEVEATFEAGQPTGATITATRNATLRLRNTHRETLEIGGATVPAGELFECDLQAQQCLRAQWQGVAARSHEELAAEARPEVLWPGYKLRPPLVPHPTGHWHDERKGHGQIGLAADGLFAATRSAV